MRLLLANSLLIVIIFVGFSGCSSEEDFIPPSDNDENSNDNSAVDGNQNDKDDSENDSDISECTPNKILRCVEENGKSFIRCNNEGTGTIVEECDESSVCINANCVVQDCPSGTRVCNNEDPTAVYECNEEGTKMNPTPVEQCDQTVGAICVSGGCLSLCDISATRKSYEGCDYFPVKMRYGLLWDLSYSVQGTFTKSCAVSGTGFKYTTMNIDGIDETTGENYHNFSLVISNGSELLPAQISVTFSDTLLDPGGEFCTEVAGGSMECEKVASLKNLTIPPSKVAIVKLPSGDSILSDTGWSFRSYNLTSTIPVAAYQFNPLDATVQKATKDASILIPSSALYSDYTVLSLPHGTATSRGNYPPSTVYDPNTELCEADQVNYKPATVAIVGVSDTDVNIVVTPPAGIEFGGELTDNGMSDSLKPMPINLTTLTSPLHFTLIKHQVIHIVTKNADDDLTGMKINCQDNTNNCAPFAVYTGHTGAEVPRTIVAQDHFEHQLFPDQTWGREFVVVKTKLRGEEKDYLKIVAREDGTEITFSKEIEEDTGYPSTTSTSTFTLNTGEHKSFLFQGALIVSASKPIMVGQFITGARMICPDGKVCAEEGECPTERPVCDIKDGDTTGVCRVTTGADCSLGDPSLMLVPAAGQYRKKYSFVTPPGFDDNLASIVVSKGVIPKIDGVDVPNLIDIENTNYRYAIYSFGTEFKRHTLECGDFSCGLTLYGWSGSVSYAYTGGLDLKELR